jgi:hypothetical protein
MRAARKTSWSKVVITSNDVSSRLEGVSLLDKRCWRGSRALYRRKVQRSRHRPGRFTHGNNVELRKVRISRLKGTQTAKVKLDREKTH